ncbi:hypothetical protein ACMFMF_003244 [Clarireedia jacksonii]
MSRTPLTPVHFFSHGSTMMLGEESASATYWKKCGDEALANGIQHVVMMVSFQTGVLPCVWYQADDLSLGCTLGSLRRRNRSFSQSITIEVSGGICRPSKV